MPRRDRRRDLLVVPNGSPFDADKLDVRLKLAVARVVESGLPLVYVNQVGGQDELVFDGASFVLNADRTLVAQLPAGEEHVATMTLAARRRGLGRRFRADRGRAAHASRRSIAR